MASALDRAFEAVLGSAQDITRQSLENAKSAPVSNEIYVKEGILKENEEFETIYLDEDEIEKYLEQYMRENPGTEVETRYINQAPVSVPQNIEVRWLRPVTPEIPPIVIQEVNVVEKEEPPIKIVQKSSRQEEEATEPIVIREKPMPFTMPEPKTIYLPTLIKRENQENIRDIKIEHVRSDSQSNYDSRLVYDDQVFDNNTNKKQQAYSYEHVNSTIDYDEDEDDARYKTTYSYKAKNRSTAEEDEIQLYEEKLMQTLYEEYLLKLERERLERKLSQSGIFEERIIQRERERSLSQERSFTQSQRMSNRYTQNRSQNRFSTSQSQARINEERMLHAEEIRMQRIRDEELRLEQERLRDEELARYSRLSRIRLASEQRTKDEKEKQLREQLNQRVRNASFKQDNRSLSFNNSIVNKGPSDGTASSFKSINFTKVTDETELNQWNKLVNSVSGVQNPVQTERTLSSIANLDPVQQILESLNKTNSKTDYYSVKSPNYEPSNRETLDIPRSGSGISRSGSGLRRQKIETSYTSYYSSNYPNSVTEKNVYVRKEEI